MGVCDLEHSYWYHVYVSGKKLDSFSLAQYLKTGENKQPEHLVWLKSITIKYRMYFLFLVGSGKTQGRIRRQWLDPTSLALNKAINNL